GRQISQYDQDIACGQLKSDRNPSKNRTQTSRLRQRSANFSSLLGLCFHACRCRKTAAHFCATSFKQFFLKKNSIRCRIGQAAPVLGSSIP
ncbi:hypothetical protein, partial [Rhizobium ruizarguesonis]|uniref:hypothetical protein n=1 Tax=Rhizobium ruizarguesonis TaxID=2081791 RepID=UPI001954F8C8